MRSGPPSSRAMIARSSRVSLSGSAIGANATCPDDVRTERDRPHDRRRVGRRRERVLVFDGEHRRLRVEAHRRPRLSLRSFARARMRVHGKMRRVGGRDGEPAVARDLRDELREEIEQAIEGVAAGEAAHFGRQDRLEQRLVQVTRDAIAHVDAVAAHLDEEAVVVAFGHTVGDGTIEHANELAGASFGDVAGGARALGPETVSRIAAVRRRARPARWWSRLPIGEDGRAGRPRCSASTGRR